jgi:hypothetical protein
MKCPSKTSEVVFVGETVLQILALKFMALIQIFPIYQSTPHSGLFAKIAIRTRSPSKLLNVMERLGCQTS